MSALSPGEGLWGGGALPAVCPVQAVLQQGPIASHQAATAADLPGFPKLSRASCGDTRPGMLARQG